MLTEGGLLYFKGGGGGDGGRVLRKQWNIPLYQKRNMHEYFGVRVPRIQNGMVRVPRIPNGIQIGDNLVHKYAMRLANVQTFGSECAASKQSMFGIWLRRS
jgi:hypothetical protein